MSNKYSGTNTHYEEGTSYVGRLIPAGTVLLGAIQKANLMLAGTTPLIKVIFVASEPTEGLDNPKHPAGTSFANHRYAKNEFWMTDKAMDEAKGSSIIRFLGILAKNVGGEDMLNKWKALTKTVNSDAEYAEKIEEFFGGKEFAGLVTGKKYMDKNDQERTESSLHVWGSFARPAKDIAELEEVLSKMKPYEILKDETPQDTVPATQNGDNSDSNGWAG